MRVTFTKLGVLSLALATTFALAIPNDAFAQRGGGGGGGAGHGGGGGRGGEGGGGGHAGGGRGGDDGGGQSGGRPQAGNHGGGNYNGGNRGGSGPNWNDGGNGRGNQYYGGGNRGNGRPGSSNLNQFYGGHYGSGYRGNNFGYGGGYGYGHPGFGPSYGNYGYGYFPWYVGLATYGAGIGRGYGYGGYGNGYVGQSAPVIVERTVESPAQPATTPQNDYIPQMNRTTTVLGAQASGAAVLGVTMDPQYPNAAVVRQVTPGSAAEKGGLRAGDMLTAIDKAEIRNPADVTNLIAAKQVGDQLEIAFIRPVLRSEVKEAAPEQGLGITAAAPVQAPADQSTEAPETIPPPVPQPPAPQAD